MNALVRSLNGLMALFGFHVSRTTSFEGLKSELQRTQQQLDQASTTLKTALEQREQERLLHLSQSRWRADEQDAGLTWGVPMVGDEFVRFLLQHVAITPRSTIVEIGPGYGRILDSLLKHDVPFRRYIGLEISTARVNRLRNRFRDPRIEFREADVMSAIELNSAADLTFSPAVFEHLYPDFSIAARNISAFIRPGGAVVIDFVRDDRDIDRSGNWFERETYIRIYSPHELKTLFENSGFTLNEVGRVSFGSDIEGREITRTIVFGTKGSPAGPELDSIRSTRSQTTVDVPPFSAFVNEPEPADPYRLDPPLKPEFRSSFGGFWTDLSTADGMLAGKVAVGEITPSEARLVNTWRRDGFIILPGAVGTAAIDRALADFENACSGLLDRRIQFWDNDGVHLEPASSEYLRKKDAKLLDLHEVSEAVQAVIFAEPISRFLDILFERPALAFQSLGFYYGSQQELHQDSAFVRVNSALEFVASWIALEDIQPGSGELEYYPGSHALPHHLFGGSRLWVDTGDPEILQFSESLHSRAKAAGLARQRFLAKKGDVLIWAPGLMHGGSTVEDPTLSRKSLVTHYCPADRQPMFAYKSGRQKRRLESGHYVMAEHWGEAPKLQTRS